MIPNGFWWFLKVLSRSLFILLVTDGSLQLSIALDVLFFNKVIDVSWWLMVLDKNILRFSTSLNNTQIKGIFVVRVTQKKRNFVIVNIQILNPIQENGYVVLLLFYNNLLNV